MFGTILKNLRLEKNITQKDLAKHLGVTDRSVGYYETGQRTPPPDILEKIADYFNVSVDYLLGRTEERNPYQTEENNSKSDGLIEYIIEEAEKHGYNLRDKSKEEIAKIVVKALKIDEISKSN